MPDVLFLDISKLQFLIKKGYKKNFQLDFFLLLFLVIKNVDPYLNLVNLKCWIRIRILIRIQWIWIHSSGYHPLNSRISIFHIKRSLHSYPRQLPDKVNNPEFKRRCCCGYGSGFNGVPGSVSGSSRAKMTHKQRKKLINFIFWSAGCSLLGHK